MLAKENTRKLALEKQRMATEQYFDKLTFQLQSNRDIPCFVVAPRYSGKTSLVFRYTQQYWQGDDVHWLDGSSESFKQGIEAGTLSGFLTKRNKPENSRQLLIIDDLAYLEPWLAEKLSDEIDDLINQKWQIVVITVPQHDCYEILQSDRYLISGAVLLDENCCSFEQKTQCVAHFLNDALPLEIRLFATLTVILQELSVDEACTMGFSVHDDLPKTVSSLNPLFSCDPVDTARLVVRGMSLLQLMPAIQGVFSEYHLDVPSEDRSNRVIEDLARLSMVLLNRGLHARSHELLACIETLFNDESELNPLESIDQSAEQSELYIGQVLVKELEATEAHIQGQQRALEPLYIRLFGALEVYRGNTRVEHVYLNGNRIQSLLALLVVSPRKCVSREMAIQQFWPNMSTERAVNNFHVACSRLGKSLSDLASGSGRYLLRSGTLYHLDTSLLSSDVDQFEQLAQNALLNDVGMTMRLEAVKQMEIIYRDELLAGRKLEGILEQYRKRHRSLLVDALLAAASSTKEIGDLHAALWFTRRAYDYDHSREDVYRDLMDTQLKAGQRTSAIETYFACKDFLHKELGILPSLKTTALYQDLILNQG